MIVNDYLISVILGIVEGLTEFIPVSSTAHLRLTEALLHFHYPHLSLESGYWKMYSIVIQLGAILTLPIYFRERIAKFVSTFPKGERGDRTILTHPLSLVMIAFVVTAIPSYLLVKVIGQTSGEPVRDRDGAADWRNCDVVYRREDGEDRKRRERERRGV